MTLATVAAAGAIDLTPEEQKFMDQVSAKMQSELEKFQKGYITETKLNETLTAQFKTFASQFPDPESINKLKEQLDAAGLEIKSLKEKGTGSTIYKSIHQQLVEGLNKENFKAALFNGDPNAKHAINIDLSVANFKQVGTVARPTGASWLPPATYDMQWGWTQVNVPKLRLISDVATTSTSRVIWMEGGAREGTAGETGEGLTKNQLDSTPVMKSVDAKKLTGFYNFTEEMMDDFPGFLAEMEKDIMAQINSKEDAQFIVGTGLTIYLAGVTSYAESFTLTTISTVSPNTYDAIVACITQIQVNGYNPNAVVMHPVDITNMKLSKSTVNGEYLLMDPSGAIMPEITVVPSTNLTVGKILVGDFSKYHIRDYKNLALRFGYVGNNFTDNIQTAIGEKRVLAYVKGGEEGAFVYDDIADVLTAITYTS